MKRNFNVNQITESVVSADTALFEIKMNKPEMFYNSKNNSDLY